MLLTICVVIFGYMLFFADRGEGAATQAMLMGSVTTVIALLMMLLVFLDHPHGDGVGKLKPVAMERTLRQAAAELEVAGVDLQVPCDAAGNPR